MNVYLDCVDICLKFAKTFSVFPLDWERCRFKLAYTENKLKFCIWINTIYFMFVGLLYGIGRLILELYHPTPNFEAFKITIYFLYFFIICFDLIYHFTLFFKYKHIVQLKRNFFAIMASFKSK